MQIFLPRSILVRNVRVRARVRVRVRVEGVGVIGVRGDRVQGLGFRV